MARNASLFLALRYLRPKRSFVSIITIISILGVMLGVGVLVVVISVMKGFELDFKKLVIGFEPHILLEQDRMPDDFVPNPDFPSPEPSNWRDVIKEVSQHPEVVSAAPFAAGMVFLEFQGEPQAIQCFALPDKGAEPLIDKLSGHFENEDSHFDLNGDNIVLADYSAAAIGARVGDVITVYASSNLKELVARIQNADDNQDEATKARAYEEMRDLVLPQELTVTGILRAESAGSRGYVPLYIGQEMFGLGDAITGIGIEVQEPNDADRIAENLTTVLPFDWYGQSWMDMHRSRLAAVQNERTMMYFVLSFIVLVAAFSVMNTTITVTVQKRREIGILTALGSRVNQIVGIFVAQAAIVAVLGTLLGLAGGALVLKFRNQIREGVATLTGRDIFPADIYFLSSIPAHTQTSDIVTICTVSIVLCLIAAILPAWFAARVDPAVALRD